MTNRPDPGGPPPAGPPPAGPAPFTGLLVAFARELRAAGITVGTGDVLAYAAAMRPLDPTDLEDLYWAGRITLISRHEDIPGYDEVFRRFFGGQSPLRGPLQPRPAAAAPTTAAATADAQPPLLMPGSDAGPEHDERQPLLGWMASNVETLRYRSFTACTPEELAALRRILARIRLTPPRRRTRRTVAAAAGTAPHVRATIRASMRMHGDPARLLFRQRRTRLRPLILILDVSGSMADYSRHLLQFAHTARRASDRVEVFCFGTRLTRVTRALAQRQPDAALQRAAREVVDWDGGTRIGQSLDTFVRLWARRGLCRGGVVVICSDGLDRGDPATLAAAMERLSRLCYRIVWLSPHHGGDQPFQPNTIGMIAAAPHIDRVQSCHNLASLEQLAAMLPALS